LAQVFIFISVTLTSVQIILFIIPYVRHNSGVVLGSRLFGCMKKGITAGLMVGDLEDDARPSPHLLTAFALTHDTRRVVRSIIVRAGVE